MQARTSLVLAALCLGLAAALPVPDTLSAAMPFPHDQFVRDVNEVQSIWKAGLNARFQGATLGYLRSIMGTVIPTPDYAQLPTKDVAARNDLPTNFDVRDNWKQCASVTGHIRDQASCGSCWAFGSTEAFNDRLCIATNGNYTTELSADDVLSCCHEWTLPDFCGMGCNGGNPTGAWKYFRDHGVVTGGDYGGKGCYPYQIPPCEHHVNGSRPECKEGGGTPKCPAKCADGSDFKKDKVKAKSAYSISSKPEDIMTELYNHGSVTAAFTVYEDFVAYKSGVYKHTTGSALGGHAIKIMGWGEENGTPYWLVANSWNTDWGDNGTFKILRGSNECGIEGMVSAGEAI